MADDDRNLTMLPLSTVPPETVRDESAEGDGASSHVQRQVSDLTGFLPVMVEVLPSPVLVMDDHFRLVVANAAARRLLWDEDISFIGYSVGRFLSMERLEGARITLLSRAGVHTYRDTVLVGGVEREVDVHLDYLETAGREFLCATLSDETEHDRERAEWTESQSVAPPPSARIDHAHRLEALGHLTGSVAHEFNNLLSVILGSLEAAERRLELGKDPRPDIRRAKMAVERSTQAAEDILRYARSRRPEPEPLSPRRLLTDLRGLIERAAGDEAEVEFDLRDTAPIRVGPSQLETAVLNLVINARDALGEGGGKVELLLLERNLSEKSATSLGLLPGRHACILVKDQGEGMTEDVKKHVFEPFYTTKPQGSGTGLGLSTVRSVTRKYRGAVVLDSELGVGTSVEMIFPIAPAPSIV